MNSMMNNRYFPILLMFSCLVALGINPDYASAQTQGQSRSVSIRVGADVLGSIRLTTIKNMDFGTIQPGQQTVNISPVSDPEAAKMVAAGKPEARIRVSYLSQWELTNTQANSSITFTYRVAGSDIDNQETAELLETENRDLTFNSEGEYYFWIGGTADISNAQPGNYEGEFTIEIEYI